MTAGPSIDLPGWMAEQLSQASPDLLRQMVQSFAEALMSAEVDAVYGAGYGQRSPDRSNTRNGYRHRACTMNGDTPHPEVARRIEVTRSEVTAIGGGRLRVSRPRLRPAGRIVSLGAKSVAV